MAEICESEQSRTSGTGNADESGTGPGVDTINTRVARLRDWMHRNGLDAFVVTGTDPHQSEYPPDRYLTRGWISGFHGSAGTVVITAAAAGLWTDGRYFLEAETALKGSLISLFRQGVPGVPEYPDWLVYLLGPGKVAGYDGWCISIHQERAIRSRFENGGVRFVATSDPFDEIWDDRPDTPDGPAELYPVEFSGETRPARLQRMRERLAETGASYHVLSTLDDVAWCFQIRGSDVRYNPVVISYAVLEPGQPGAHLFIDPDKLSTRDAEKLRTDGVTLHPYSGITGFLEKIPDRAAVSISPASISPALYKAIPGSARIIESEQITTLPKATRSGHELKLLRRCMIRDGAAMVRFLADIEKLVRRKTESGDSPLTELSAARILSAIRAEDRLYVSDSFQTISGYKEHGAVIHYAATPESDRVLGPDGLYLIDSGGQYRDGTTDITRTVTLGTPTERQKQDYTLVLKSHIALARLRFPAGTPGTLLDTVARVPLWMEGINYGHGTGHGVGFFLNVHEGPHKISPVWNPVPLEPGMVVSNEPGLYRPGEYGIRIENLVTVREDSRTEFDRFLSFETLTLCPLDKRLMEISLLRPDEINWINAYHQRTFISLGPDVTDHYREWLAEATAPLSHI